MILFLLLFSLVSFADDLTSFRPGFYTVEGSERCQKKYGKVIYLNKELMHSRRDCSFSYENNDLKTVGICTRVMAHRGLPKGEWPGNTIAAFDAALDDGFHGIEFDIWTSKDGVAMVSHDQNLNAATNCKGKLSEKTEAELRQCSVVRSPVLPEKRFLSKGSDCDDRDPPTCPKMVGLKDVLERYKHDPRAERLVLDVKPNPGGQALVDAMKVAFPACEGEECERIQKKLTFISNSREDLKLMKKAFPHSSHALESNTTVSGLIDTPDADLWSDECDDFDTLSVSYGSLFNFGLKLVKFFKQESLIPKKKFKQLYQNNDSKGAKKKRLLGWTVNNEKGIRSLREYNFEEVLTDMPFHKVVKHLMQDISQEEMVSNIEKLKNNGPIACEPQKSAPTE